MTACDTLQYMATNGRDRPTTPRGRVGKAAKELLNYFGLTPAQAGGIASNLSYATIKRIIAGDPRISDAVLQSMAGVLNLPVNLFVFIADEDYAAIQGLTLDVHVRDYLSDLMPELLEPPPRRRPSDHDDDAKALRITRPRRTLKADDTAQ